MSIRAVRTALMILAVASFSGWVAGCKEDPANVLAPSKSGKVVNFQPPDGSSARSLGITQGPITAEQAKAIAAASAGGTAITVEAEDDDGIQVFGVLVQVSGTQKDVKVRISDGAVTKIEDGGPDGAAPSEGESD